LEKCCFCSGFRPQKQRFSRAWVWRAPTQAVEGHTALLMLLSWLDWLKALSLYKGFEFVYKSFEFVYVVGASSTKH